MSNINFRKFDNLICDFRSRNTCSVTWSMRTLCEACLYKYYRNMVKRCAWGTFRNDSRFQHLQTKNKNGDPVTFYRFPAPKRWKETAERRERWIIACHRGDSFVCKKDSYICSLHFVGENGPTPQHPDPISAIKSKEKVCRMYLRVSL
jgi:hypothetical protein